MYFSQYRTSQLFFLSLNVFEYILIDRFIASEFLVGFLLITLHGVLS